MTKLLQCRFGITHREYVISGFRLEVDEMCALLGSYAALSGNCVPTFRYNLSVPSSRVKSKTLEDVTDSTETSVRN